MPSKYDPEKSNSRRLVYAIQMDDECIEWWGKRTADGYGIHRRGRFGLPTWVHKQAHRMIYEEAFGLIPEGMTIDHVCRNRGCVNPNHLEVVSQSVNTIRGHMKTHCKRGHLLSDGNLYFEGDRRRCRACCQIREKSYRNRKRILGETIHGQEEGRL